MVEFATGIIFMLTFLKLQMLVDSGITAQFLLSYLYYISIFSVLMVVTVYDIKHKIIPDILAIVFGVLSFIGLFLFDFSGPYAYLLHFHLPNFLSILSGLIVASPFAFFWLVSSGRWMGLGDAKLALGIGWFLGLSQAFSALAVSFWIGSIFGIFLVLSSKKYKMKSEIPFAPYLVLGTILAFLFNLHLFF
jgi:leader peptidase (prepilin peptidase)/N-methyltransferase